MQNDPWAKFRTRPAASGPINTGVPVSQQTSPAEAQRLGLAQAAEARAQRKDARVAEAEALELQQDQERVARNTKNARYALLKAIGELNRIAIDADDNEGWFETGTSGQFARSILPGANAGKDLAGDIETLNADFAFSALNAMREASKTGGALGQVTERELDLLKASTANISPDLTHETFLKNVEKARQVYLSKLAAVDEAKARELGYNPRSADSALQELNQQYEKRFGGPEPTGRGPKMTPEREALLRKYSQ